MREIEEIEAEFKRVDPKMEVTVRGRVLAVTVGLHLGTVNGDVKVPLDGRTTAEILFLMADGGKGEGKGDGRKIIDNSVRALESLGLEKLVVENGSPYWDKQQDFTRFDDGDVTHVRRLGKKYFDV